MPICLFQSWIVWYQSWIEDFPVMQKAIMEGVSALSPTCESLLDYQALKELA